MSVEFRVFDSDSHFIEPVDLWRHIDPAYRGRGPVAVADHGGLVVDGHSLPTVRFKGVKRWNESLRTDYRAYQARGWDPGAYLEAMAKLGVERMALFPSRGLMQVAARGLDPQLASAIVRAYNDWVAEFLVGADDRIVGIGQLDLRDVGAAIAEARRGATELGFRGFFILPEPPLPGVTLDRPYYDPLWSALEDLGLALAVHNVAGTDLGQIGADRFGDWALPRIAFAFPLEAQVALFQFLAGGICERHPNLRVVVLESGAGWLPFWLWWLDELTERYRGLDVPELSLRPSEYFRRQCFVSADLEEPTLPAVIDALGVGPIVTALDFPHPEARPGYGAFLQRADFGDDAKRRILWDNPARLYGVQP